MTALASRTRVRSAPRFEIWVALGLAFAALTLPNCCLNGRHAVGIGMDTFAPICRAAR